MINFILGEEWSIFKLGFCGRITNICVDTAHFKGNYPDTIKIEGAFVTSEWAQSNNITWFNILKRSKVSVNYYSIKRPFISVKCKI